MGLHPGEDAKHSRSSSAPPLPTHPKIPCNVHIGAGMGGVGSQGHWGRVPGAELRLQVAVHVGGGLVPQHKVVAVEGNQATCFSSHKGQWLQATPMAFLQLEPNTLMG